MMKPNSWREAGEGEVWYSNVLDVELLDVEMGLRDQFEDTSFTLLEEVCVPKH